jgi:hypothetical protein
VNFRQNSVFLYHNTHLKSYAINVEIKANSLLNKKKSLYIHVQIKALSCNKQQRCTATKVASQRAHRTTVSTNWQHEVQKLPGW